jgi:hypothetical protein
MSSNYLVCLYMCSTACPEAARPGQRHALDGDWATGQNESRGACPIREVLARGTCGHLSPIACANIEDTEPVHTV